MTFKGVYLPFWPFNDTKYGSLPFRGNEPIFGEVAQNERKNFINIIELVRFYFKCPK